MTPAAILDILVRANTARAQTQLAGVQKTVQKSDKEVEKFAINSERNLKRVHRAAHLLIGASGLGALAFGLKDVTAEALKADAEQRKLAVGVKNAGISWKAHREQIDKTLVSASLWSGFAKSDLSAALTNAVRTTGSLTKAHELLNISMNVARTRGVDLAGAQTLVARAYLGNLRGLKTLGIGIEPVTKAHDRLHGAIVKLGDEIRNSNGATKEQLTLAKERLQSLKDEATAEDNHATRIKAIGLLQSKFAGQAKAYAQSSAGQFERARSALQIAQETIGKALLPAMASAATEVAKIAKGIERDWPEIKQTISETVGPIWSFAKGVGAFVAHHRLLREAAITFASLAVAVKAIEKVGALTGITRLAGLLGGAGRGAARGGAGVVGDAALLAAIARGGGQAAGLAQRATDAEVAAGRTSSGTFLLGTGAISARQEAILARRAAIAQARLAPGLAARAISTARGGLGAVGRRIAPLLPGLALGGAVIGGEEIIRRATEKVQGIPTTGGFLGNLARNNPITAVFGGGDQIGLVRKFGDEIKKLGPLSQASTEDLRKMRDEAQALALGFPKYGDALNKFGDAATQALVGQASDAFRQTATAGGESLKRLRRDVDLSTGEIAGQLGSRTAEGKEALRKNFELAAQAVRDSMDASGRTTKAGLALIRQYMIKALEQYGLDPSSARSYYDKTGPKPGRRGAAGRQGLATGGFIGAQGMAGADTELAMLGKGEAVLTRHQQKPVEAALQATYGVGLADLIGSIQRPHFMAQGGFAGDIPRVKVRDDLGTLSRISQGAVDKDRAAARAFLQRVLGTVQPATGGGGALPATSFSGSQAQIARIITEVGKSMGAPAIVLLAAIETGIVESGLRNLRYGDRDSLGVFQQRPSQGWGSPAQVLDVHHAAASFFSRAIPLADSGMTAGQIAQAVQRSAFPGRYDANRASAVGILHRLGIRGFARGGFLGRTIRRLQGGLAGDITNITSGLPAPNHPAGSKAPKKGKAPEKPRKYIDPRDPTRTITVTPSRYRELSIQARLHPRKTSRFRPATGKIESHTPAEWQRISVQDAYRRAHPVSTPAQRAAQFYQDLSSQVDVEIAQASLETAQATTPDEAAAAQAHAILAQTRHLTLAQSRLTSINRALASRKISPKTAQRLTTEKAQILGDIQTTQQTIGDLKAGPTTTGTGEDPNQALIDSNNALAAAIQQAADLESQRIDAIKSLDQAMQAHNAIAGSTVGISLREAQRALADMISGELGGRVASRGRTAAAGSTYSF